MLHYLFCLFVVKYSMLMARCKTAITPKSPYSKNAGYHGMGALWTLRLQLVFISIDIHIDLRTVQSKVLMKSELTNIYFSTNMNEFEKKKWKKKIKENPQKTASIPVYFYDVVTWWIGFIEFWASKTMDGIPKTVVSNAFL